MPSVFRESMRPASIDSLSPRTSVLEGLHRRPTLCDFDGVADCDSSMLVACWVEAEADVHCVTGLVSW